MLNHASYVTPRDQLANTSNVMVLASAAHLLMAEFTHVIEVAGDEPRMEEWLGSELRAAIGSDVEVE